MQCKAETEASADQARIMPPLTDIRLSTVLLSFHSGLRTGFPDDRIIGQCILVPESMRLAVSEKYSDLEVSVLVFGPIVGSNVKLVDFFWRRHV